MVPRSHRPRRRALLAVECLLLALLPAAAVARGDRSAEPVHRDAQLTVMTRNLYVGAGVGAVFAAASEAELVAAGSRAWADLQASDFPARARALADEVAAATPDVLGLQEVTLWRDQAPGDALTRPGPDAGHVALDVLAVLRGELAARGVPYTPVATATNVDVEFPRLDPGGGLVDLRLTDRDVLLVRADRIDRVADAATGSYAAQFAEPTAVGPVPSTRSWTSVDYRPAPSTTVRVLHTHLEVADAATGSAQQRQAGEFLALVAASPHPVVALGDFNSPADGSGTATYRDLTAVLRDAWTAVRPDDPGWTCCSGLADPVRRHAARLDLVLASTGLRVDGVARTGDRPVRAAPPPLWASDHLGVVARFTLPAR